MTTRREDFIVELLTPRHHRQAFDCGVPALNSYLQKQARQDMERRATTAYVLVSTSEPDAVAGYYTLAATALRLTDLPDATIRKLPRYPLLPATLLGRLAVSLAHQGKRLGEYLLLDALKRSVAASQRVASAAVVVDAKDAGAVRFYLPYGFIPFPDQPLRLFIAMKTLEQL